MLEALGLDTSRETPKALTRDMIATSDLAVTLGCGEECPYVPGVRYVDWPVDDPKGQDDAEVRRIVGDLDTRVRALLVELVPDLDLPPSVVTPTRPRAARRTRRTARLRTPTQNTRYGSVQTDVSQVKRRRRTRHRRRSPTTRTSAAAPGSLEHLLVMSANDAMPSRHWRSRGCRNRRRRAGPHRTRGRRCGMAAGRHRRQARHRRAPSARRGHRPGRGRPLQRQPLVRVGPVPLRARVGHRAGGLQRARRRVELVPPRPRPVARLPVERGRDGGPVRHPPRALPGPVAVERRGPDPQGADVRPDRPAGQPRRGRQGVLVVPRRPAQPLAAALALPLPPGRLPVPAPHRRERAPRAARSASTS